MEGRDLGIAVGLSLTGLTILLVAVGLAVYYFLKCKKSNNENGKNTNGQAKKTQIFNIDLFKPKTKDYKNIDHKRASNCTISSQQTFVCGDSFGTGSSRSMLVYSPNQQKFAKVLDTFKLCDKRPAACLKHTPSDSSSSNNSNPSSVDRNTINSTYINMNYTTNDNQTRLNRPTSNWDEVDLTSNSLNCQNSNGTDIFITPNVENLKKKKNGESVPTSPTTTTKEPSTSSQTTATTTQSPSTTTQSQPLTTQPKTTATNVTTQSSLPQSTTVTLSSTTAKPPPSTQQPPTIEQQPQPTIQSQSTVTHPNKNGRDKVAKSIVTEDLWNSTVETIFNSALSLHEVDRGTLRGARTSFFPK